MACVPRLYSKSIGLSWLWNYCTHPLLGGVCLSSRPTTSGSTLRHCVRSGLYPSQLTAEELIDSADDKLFDHVLRNGDHLLHELLPERVDISYNLRFRSHDKSNPGEEVTFSRKRTLSRGRYVKAHINRTHILTLPPITRLLFKDSYWYSILFYLITVCAKLSGAVYCNWSYLWVCLCMCACEFVGLLPW